MKNINQLPKESIKYIFTDIDDTLTTKGQLTATAYSSLEELSRNGFFIVPVTGRPAGWCDMIARFWPVHGVIGENGAFYFSYQNKKMKQLHMQSEQVRASNQQLLAKIREEVLREVPGSASPVTSLLDFMTLPLIFVKTSPHLQLLKLITL